MSRRTRPLAPALAFGLAMALASDARADEYAAGADRLSWVLVTSDTHIGSSGDRDKENLAWVTREAYLAARPDRVVLTGDLTDATAGDFFIPWNQQDDEWTDYRALLDASGMTADTLIDIPGNHDQYGDKGMPHYLASSIQGSATGRTQQSVRLPGPDGGVHLLALCTAGNDGGLPPIDNAGLDAGELQFAQKALDDQADAAATLVFGHHPVDDFRDGKAELEALLQASDAALYIYGHTHKYEAFFRGRTLHFNQDTLGKSDANNVTLAAVDGGSLAVRAFDAGTWPLVLATAPADVDLGGGNPRAYTVPPDYDACPVRALVFGDRPADAVRFQVDDRPWADLHEVQPGVWAGTFDSTGLATGHHALTVQASPWNAKDHRIAFRVGATACRNGSDDDSDGLTDWPEDPGCASPLGNDESADPPPDPDLGPADTGPADLPPEALPEVPVEGPADLPAGDLPGGDAAGADGTGADEPAAPDAAAPDPAVPGPDVPGRDSAAEAGADLPPGPDVPCVAGALRCRVDTVEQCAADGTWAPVESCLARGLQCRDGACVKGPSGGGCATTAAGPAPAPALVLPVLLGLALAALRRPRRCP